MPLNDIKKDDSNCRSYLAIFFLLLFLTNCSPHKVFSDINHIVHTGQSLAGGEQSLPVVTDSATGFGNLKFKTGTSTWTYNYYPDQPERRSDDNFAFVALTARQRGVEGETIANGLCDHLKRSIQGLPYKNARFLFSYSGQGGRYLREVDKRHDDAKDPRAGARQSKGGYYHTAIDDVKRAKRMADSLHLSYAVTAVTWMQGERGNDSRVNRWDSLLTRDQFLSVYRQDLIDLKNDYQQDITRITGQKKNPSFFTYQTVGTMSGTAQLMACDQEKDMYMVAPTYMLPTARNGYYYNAGKIVHGAAIHLSADGERWLGELFGKVIRRVVVDKENWQPLRPLKAWYGADRKTITVQFHVPDPPLVIDTFFLPRQGTGAGFEIYGPDHQSYPVDKVVAQGNDKVMIYLKNQVPAGVAGFVRYGLNSYTGDVSKPVKEIWKETDTITVLFEGNIINEFSGLMAEGVFCLGIRPGGNNGQVTRLVIRRVYVNANGETVLKGEMEDGQTGLSDGKGQQCFTARVYAFGNLRDSDATISVFTFADPTYGRRFGQPYPLYNWSVVFQDLEVLDR